MSYPTLLQYLANVWALTRSNYCLWRNQKLHSTTCHFVYHASELSKTTVEASSMDQNVWFHHLKSVSSGDILGFVNLVFPCTGASLYYYACQDEWCGHHSFFNFLFVSFTHSISMLINGAIPTQDQAYEWHPYLKLEGKNGDGSLISRHRLVETWTGSWSRAGLIKEILERTSRSPILLSFYLSVF